VSKDAQWFEDAEFWECFAPIMFDDAHWIEVPAVADAVTRLSRFNLYCDNSEEPLASSPRVLDLCCGFGRISAELARMGSAVTGVDITETYLKTAREEAEYENLEIEYIQADARKFVRPEFFDAAVNLYISFGYFSDQKDDLLVLRNVYESLKKGGSFIIETLGKEIAVRDFVEAEWFERAGFTVLTEYEALDSWTFLKNRWILIKDGKRLEKTFTQRLYSASELRTLLHEAGFKKVEIYGNWDESPYDRRAAKLIAVGRK
jgi:SAM-dependent methyltransferase